MNKFDNPKRFQKKNGNERTKVANEKQQKRNKNNAQTYYCTNRFVQDETKTRKLTRTNHNWKHGVERTPRNTKAWTQNKNTSEQAKRAARATKRNANESKRKHSTATENICKKQNGNTKPNKWNARTQARNNKEKYLWGDGRKRVKGLGFRV